MIKANLEGFDFLATDLKDRIRFCNPLVSFGDREGAPIYVAQQLQWIYDSENEYHSLVPISPEQITSFATRMGGNPVSIQPGDGVIVMGDGFATAAEVAGISEDFGHAPAFVDYSELHCRILIAGIERYEQFTEDLAQAAQSVLDVEIGLVSKTGFSRRGSAALRVLRSCTRSIPILAKYELMAAYVTGVESTYMRLLQRFSIELDEDWTKLDTDTRTRIAKISTDVQFREKFGSKPYEQLVTTSCRDFRANLM